MRHWRCNSCNTDSESWELDRLAFIDFAIRHVYHPVVMVYIQFTSLAG